MARTTTGTIRSPLPILTGNTFGSLTVLSLQRGAKDKHGMAECVCSCGGHRLVRQTKLRLGLVLACARCVLGESARRNGLKRRLPEPERWLREALGIYRVNARVKGLAFTVPTDELRVLLLATCVYCGAAGPGGLDRADNAFGYEPGNVLACCAVCNYAKRDMPKGEFLAWVERIHAHQSLLQRDRPVCVRVAERPHGPRAHHAGRDL